MPDFLLISHSDESHLAFRVDLYWLIGRTVEYG